MAVLTYNGNIIGKSSANDGILTITQNNITKGTFSANSSSNNTIALTDTTYDNATSTSNGLMSAADFNKLNTKSLVANDDLDNFTTLGLYACPTGAIAATVLHSPYTSNEFSLYVLPSNTQDGRIQILYPHGTADHASYIRSYYSNAWHDWKEFALKDNVIAKSSTSGQSISSTNTSAPLSLQSNSTNQSWIGFKTSDGVMKGYLGLYTDDKPFFMSAQGTTKEIALAENVVKLSSSTVQKITNTAASTVITFEQTVDVNGDAWVAFANNNGIRGYIGVANNQEPIFSNGQQKKGIALVGSAGLTGSASTNVDISKISVPALVLVANAGGNNNFEYALGMIVETSGTRYYSQIAGSLTVTCSNSTLTIPAGYNYYKILQ